MIETANATTERDEIVALCERLGRAHAERDADAIVACYAKDALIYDLAPPLGRRGIDRASVSDWLATWDGPITVDVRDDELIVEDDRAYTTALNRMVGTKRDGEAVDLWFRTTMVFARSDGRWRIVHEHSSVPFHMDGSMRAAVDLKP
jgi:uncharacterized protein (TIGR02246 family)